MVVHLEWDITDIKKIPKIKKTSKTNDNKLKIKKCKSIIRDSFNDLEKALDMYLKTHDASHLIDTMNKQLYFLKNKTMENIRDELLKE